MPKIDISALQTRIGSPNYPAPFRDVCAGRHKTALGNAVGLSQFGVNLTKLEPGAATALRHWHEQEDEFVYILEGECVLIENAGEVTLKAGDCAGFKAGVPQGHHLQNRSGAEAFLLEVGTRRPGGDTVTYPDVDMHLPAGGLWTRKDGTPYR